MKKKTLSPKEEAIMECFWQKGPLFVREVIDLLDEDPKPHFNTISTFVRGLEANGWLSHEQFGNSYRYYPLIEASEYHDWSLGNLVDRFFNSSYLGFVSSLVEKEKISTDDLKQLISKIEQKRKSEKEDK